MNTKIDELHSKAMDIADDAFIARRKGLFEQAKQLSKQACYYEKEAALLLVNEFEIEPSRSVLFRSAGWLAFNAEEYNTAKAMVDYALQGHPPYEIKEELDELSYEINAIKAVEEKTSQYQSNITNIHFNDSKNVGLGSIKLDFFAPILHSYNEFRKVISHGFSVPEQEMIATAPGSFNVYIKPIQKNQNDLFEQGILLEQRIADIVNHAIRLNDLRALKLNNNELKKLKTFLSYIRKYEASINFLFNSVENKKVNYSVDKKRAEAILDSINKLDYDNEHEEEYVGSFVAIDLKSKSFKFLPNNTEVLIGGRISDSLLYDEIKKVFFSGLYKVTILKHETKKAGEQEISSKISLIEIKEEDFSHQEISPPVIKHNDDNYELFSTNVEKTI
jgi:hypothetical protein